MSRDLDPSAGLSRVELATHGRSHCAWCDTLIAVASPRVARAFYHSPGAYSRNNGAVSGYNPGGLQEEFMHAQCAFAYDANPLGKPARCVGCGAKVAPPRRVVSRFGKPGARCTPASSAPLYYCFGCTAQFVRRHRSLLVGWLGADQSEAAVAWGSAGPFASGGGGGPPALPKDKALREQYLSCFRFDPPQSSEEAASACARHHELHRVIGEALKTDRKLHGGSSAAAAPGSARTGKKRAATQDEERGEHGGEDCEVDTRKRHAAA